MKNLMSCKYRIDENTNGIKIMAVKNDVANNIYRSSCIFAKNIEKLCNVFGFG